MKVALFIPCFIDAFYPDVGIATLELLERLGVEVDYPKDQTCCGQPMGNSGAQKEAAATERLFARNFADYDYVVGPSASCIHHVREHLTAIDQTSAVLKLRRSAYDLTEFLHDVLDVREFPWAEFPHRVSLHNSCSAIRHLRQVSVSEIAGPPFSKPRALLEGVKGIEFVSLTRPDECCGFGGTFSIKFPEVSGAMGRTKIDSIQRTGASTVVSIDSSCLMQLQGVIDRAGLPIRTMHLAEVLAST